jgi:Arc/MetJ-type ribon-helix-helix transcriptional regulator
MSTQISVRLSDEAVRTLDALVAEGRARSRASVIDRALERELRRLVAERDLEILERTKDDPDPDDLAGFVAWTEAHPVALA